MLAAFLHFSQGPRSVLNLRLSSSLTFQGNKIYITTKDAPKVVNEADTNSFEFDQVYDSLARTSDIFETLNSVEQVLRGINTTIFAYGQTGSGKVFVVFP